MRTYLVVIDETDEASLELRFASRRAMKTNSALHILALVEAEDFVAWGGVQATLEEEAKNRAEALVSGAAGSLFEETGIRPSIAGARRGCNRRSGSAGQPFCRDRSGLPALPGDGGAGFAEQGRDRPAKLTR